LIFLSVFVFFSFKTSSAPSSSTFTFTSSNPISSSSQSSSSQPSSVSEIKENDLEMLKEEYEDLRLEVFSFFFCVRVIFLSFLSFFFEKNSSDVHPSHHHEIRLGWSYFKVICSSLYFYKNIFIILSSITFIKKKLKGGSRLGRSSIK